MCHSGLKSIAFSMAPWCSWAVRSDALSSAWLFILAAAVARATRRATSERSCSAAKVAPHFAEVFRGTCCQHSDAGACCIPPQQWGGAAIVRRNSGHQRRENRQEATSKRSAIADEQQPGRRFNGRGAGQSSGAATVTMPPETVAG